MADSIEFFGLPEAASLYRKSAFPMLPQSVSLSFSPGNRVKGFQSRFFLDDAITTYKGRYALYHAFLTLRKLHPDKTRILFPAYHCPSMIEPALMAGLEPVFYRLDSQLYPLERDLFSKTGPQVLACLVVHYFAKMTPLKALKEQLKESGVFMIEDCAHCFSDNGDELPGSVGDAAIASTAKFFAGGHGGRLVFNTSKADLRLGAPPIKDELRDIKTIVQSMRISGEVYPSIEDSADTVQYMNTHITPRSLEQPSHIVTGDSLKWCHAGEAKLANGRFLNLLIGLAERETIVKNRQENFRKISECVKNRKDMELLRGSEVPFLPYVIPVRLGYPDKQFPWLKLNQVPVWRWEEVAVSDCEFTAELKNSLIQLPCHQSMSIKQRDWLIEKLNQMPDFG